MPRDFLPRAFQADCDRFYWRVVRATLNELTIYSDVKNGVFDSQDQFLDNCEKATSNLLAYEARRAFALTLSALFERQIRIWARVHFLAVEKGEAQNQPFPRVFAKIVELQGLADATAPERRVIRELDLLANAVRHGEGSAVRELWDSYPRFWDHLADPSRCHERSEFIQINDEDFITYIRAVTRFWGIADKESLAVIDGPYSTPIPISA